MKTHDDEQEWINVFDTSHLHRAALVKGILNEHGIEAVVLNKKDSSYVMLGKISIYVRLEDSFNALNILEEQSLPPE